MFFLGTLLIVAGVACALMASISYALVIGGKPTARPYARIGVVGSMMTVAASWTLLISLFLTNRFDIEYVSQYSSVDLSTFYTIAASWGGQPGSFAIWALFGSIVAALLIKRSRHFEPYVLAVLMLVQTGLIAMMLVSNPFNPLIDPNTGLVPNPPPADGQGLNPLLHNFWMIFHPPVLFLAYALVLVPFAYAIGGMLRHDYDGWVVRSFPWTLAAWVFLTIALFLGAYWAYETLGWGGYWGWDPVENSSLVPWLMLTALLHGMIVQRTYGALRRTNIVLALVTYILVFYSTFLTRSGVLTNFSVHSFVSEGLSEAMILFLVTLIIGSVAVASMRWKDIPIRPLNTSFFSRDNMLVLAIVALSVISAVITIGTSMPVISAIPGVGHSLQGFFGSIFEIDDGSALGGQPLTDGRFSLMPSFYERTVPPLGLIMTILLTISPLLSWRTAEKDRQPLSRALTIPIIVGVVGTAIAYVIGVKDVYSLIFIAVAVTAITANGKAALQAWQRHSWKQTGGYIAHIGFCLMIPGIVGSSVYATPEERVVMSTGETVSVYGYDFTFQQWQRTPEGKGALALTVERGDEVFYAYPELYFDDLTQSTMQSPAIRNYLSYDLYIAPFEYVSEDNMNQPVLQRNQPKSVGPYELVFEEFEVDEHAFSETGVAEVGARVRVRYDDEESTFIPKLNLTPKEQQGESDSPFEKTPVELPGGHEMTLEMFDPSQGMVVMKVEGLDLPIKPAQAVITVSKKPAVALVWIGVLVATLGGIVSFVRRNVERKAKLRQRVVELPGSAVRSV